MKTIDYVRRWRMEVKLNDYFEFPATSSYYTFLPWADYLVDSHAAVKCLAFRDTLDASIFPNLSRYAGCQMVMSSIADHPGFVPESTWLVRGPDGDVGCIQGLANHASIGQIQNVAVVPNYQHLGLGRRLLIACLNGFLSRGVNLVQLEVSARNTAAVKLYQSLGFYQVRTLYRETVAPGNDYSI